MVTCVAFYGLSFKFSSCVWGAAESDQAKSSSLISEGASSPKPVQSSSEFSISSILRFVYLVISFVVEFLVLFLTWFSLSKVARGIICLNLFRLCHFESLTFKLCPVFVNEIFKRLSLNSPILFSYISFRAKVIIEFGIYCVLLLDLCPDLLRIISKASPVLPLIAFRDIYSLLFFRRSTPAVFFFLIDN